MTRDTQISANGGFVLVIEALVDILVHERRLADAEGVLSDRRK